MKRVALAFAALTLLAAACSSNDGTSESGQAPFEVPGEPATTNHVELPRSYRFDPTVIEIDGAPRSPGRTTTTSPTT